MSPAPLNFILWIISERGKFLSPPNKTLLIVAFIQALTINDIQHVFEQLHESASSHWFDLGLALDLSYHVLTDINNKQHDTLSNVSCLREMLAILLSTQHVTWSLLSDALKNPTVGLINLADSITGITMSICSFLPVQGLPDYNNNSEFSCSLLFVLSQITPLNSYNLTSRSRSSGY